MGVSLLVKIVCAAGLVSGFLVSPSVTTSRVVLSAGNDDGPLGFFKRLGKGLDDIVDDAMMKKLGNGHNFYGKRKSNFYGSEDKNKLSGPWDDYSGPAGGSYFSLNEEGQPISRRGTLLPTRANRQPSDDE